MYDYLIKLLLIGDDDVGKSTFLLRFGDDQFTPSFVTTIGIDFKIRTIDLDGKRVKLQIWDTAGQDRFKTITTAYYRGAMGILLVYDVTNEKSFDNIRNWLRNIEQHASSNVSKILIGNRCHLKQKYQEQGKAVVDTARGQALAEEYGIRFFEASGEQNINVDEAFYSLTRDVMYVLRFGPCAQAALKWTADGPGLSQARCGVPAQFTVPLSSAWPPDHPAIEHIDFIKVSVMDVASSKTLPVTVVRDTNFFGVPKPSVTCTYTPVSSGPHHITINLAHRGGEFPIGFSGTQPWDVHVEPPFAPDPSRIILREGVLSSALVCAESELFLDIVDQAGQRIALTEDQVSECFVGWLVSVHPKSLEEQVSLMSFSLSGPSTVRAAYTPRVPGKYLVQVFYENKIVHSTRKMSVSVVPCSTIEFKRLPHVGQIADTNFSTLFCSEYMGQQVAVKVFKATKIDTFSKELSAIWSIGYHPCIVSLVGSGLKPKPFIVTKYLPAGSLRQKRAQLLLYQRLAVLLDVAHAMRFLHSQQPPMLHRDLKNPNVMLQQDGSEYRGRLIDFGLSGLAPVNPETQAFTLVGDDGRLVGTPEHMPPEFQKHQQFTTYSDVYCFGVMLYEVVANDDPDAEWLETLNSLQESGECPAELSALIKDCRKKSQPSSRPTFDAVVVRLQEILLDVIESTVHEPDAGVSFLLSRVNRTMRDRQASASLESSPAESECERTSAPSERLSNTQEPFLQHGPLQLVAWEHVPMPIATVSPDAPRMALVIGNQQYPHSPLMHPVAGATAVAQKLLALGFDTTCLSDLTHKQMVDALRGFSDRLKQHSGAVSVFFYCGHGCHYQQQDYILPIDEELTHEHQLETGAVRVSEVVNWMGGSDVKIVMIDCCRALPPFVSTHMAPRLRILDHPPPSFDGTLVAYSCGPGKIARDSSPASIGGHSLFVGHLLRLIAIPGVPVQLLFTLMSQAMARDLAQAGKTKEHVDYQKVHLSSDLSTLFYFVAAETLESLSTSAV